MASVPPSFADLLARPMGEVARAVLRHGRRTSFRWIGLVELSLSLLFCVCALPVFFALFLISGGEANAMAEGGDGGPSLIERAMRRLHRHHHDLTLSFYGANGGALAEVRHTPRSEDEGDAILCALLNLARAQGIVLVESIEPAEIVSVYYGGTPLLALPESIEPPKDRARLDLAGFATELIPDGLRIRHPAQPRSRVGAALLLGLLVLLLPIVLLSRSGRLALADVLADVRGLPPEQMEMTIVTSRLHFERKRGDDLREARDFDLSLLLAVRFGAELGYDRDVSRQRARLSLYEASAVHRLPIMHGDVGGPLRNLLISAAIRAQSAQTGAASHTRCPYCVTQYELLAHTRCPRCGAWAGDLVK